MDFENWNDENRFNKIGITTTPRPSVVLHNHPRYNQYHTSQHDSTISPLSSSKLEPIQINYRSRCETFPINKTTLALHTRFQKYITKIYGNASKKNSSNEKKIYYKKALFTTKIKIIITGHHNHCCLVLFIIESILKFWLIAPVPAAAAVPKLWVRLCLRRSQFLRNTFPQAEQL